MSMRETASAEIEWIARFIVLVGVAASACSYRNAPPNGAMYCGPGGAGAKRCPDDYSCYEGTLGSRCFGTCWRNG
jgi:hypothetical protein